MAIIASTQVQLFFRAEKLADMDTMSKSDPYCVLYTDNKQHGGLLKAGRTETIQDNLNPDFLKAVTVDYYFEAQQHFQIKLFDDDGKGEGKDDLLGEASFQLSHVVGARGSTAKLMLSRGCVYVTAKEVSTAGKDTVVIQFEGHHLKKMDLFGKSDPYFHFKRRLPNGVLKMMHKSKVITKNLDPKWRDCVEMLVADLTTADFDEKTMRFECFDEDTFSDDPMGFFDFSFNELMAKKQSGESFRLKDASGEDFGQILVKKVDITVVPTFFKLMQQGLQVSLAASIDFTGSNGNPRAPSSLHFMNPQQPNQYVRAIMSVGEVLMEYDSDKQVPAFGFGAKLPSGAVSHFFNLNFQENPHVNGVQGILDSYGAAIQQVQLYGPTNFAPTITSVTQVARQSPHNYTILLIMTDGEITDMDHTINAIVAADDAPLSIIIVGVGMNCDFRMMDQLDGDEHALRASNGRVCKRDLVQFVPFSKYMNAPPGALAAEVLREVPSQVVTWASMTRYQPPQ